MDNINENNFTSLKGSFLIAMPEMEDPFLDGL